MIAMLQLFAAGIVVGFCLTTAAGLIALTWVERIVVRRGPMHAVPDARVLCLQQLERADMVFAYVLGSAPMFGTKRYVESVQ